MRLAILISFFTLFLFAANAQIYVTTNGSDKAEGTKEKPLATITMALHKVRELRRLNSPLTKDSIHIYVGAGIYRFTETLVIRPEDGGTRESPTIVEGITNEQPVFDGGIKIAAWKKLLTPQKNSPKQAHGKIWVADVPMVNGRLFEFRQLWVNDVKTVRAKSINGDSMLRILDWKKADGTCWIPTPKFPDLQNDNGIEMFIHQWWAIAILRIRKMEVHGDSTQLFFHRPESTIQNEHPWPSPWLSKETGNSAFYLVNALQFLDEPGEWYLDASNRKLYYWPRTGENLQTAQVIAPYTETLVRLDGTEDYPVKNFFFKGITFSHTGWVRPSYYGHVPHQAGMYMTEAYKLRPAGTKVKSGLDNQSWIGRPAAAVEMGFVNKAGFENCSFMQTASTGLDLLKGVHSVVVKGCLFKEIGGNGLVVGNFGEDGREIHLPYNPFNENEACSMVWIRNNLFTNIGNEDWSCVAIASGFAKNISIEHNEIENVPYSGISLGWGWTSEDNMMNSNLVKANKIHHFGRSNYDCAGIYTQSNQAGSEITENYIDSIYKAPYAHLPSHWFYLYADEGSSGIKFTHNWTPTTKYLQNANGPGNWWNDNGPQVDNSIKQSAGLEQAYRHLLIYKSLKANLPINEEHAEVIELILKDGKPLDVGKLKQLLAKNNIDSNAVYQWQNHTVVFAKMADVGVMRGRLQNNFPEAEVKVYYDLFYEYNKKKHCDDKTVSDEWEHVLLTANLVDNSKLQKEYMDYHATQFEKWPEIAKGFCNASFQQLLLYRNGRQLMLVISIPKGESLDKLNPKTTENNPRVDDWNKIMGKYQEGIKGTKPGEKWVFLQKINN